MLVSLVSLVIRLWSRRQSRTGYTIYIYASELVDMGSTNVTGIELENSLRPTDMVLPEVWSLALRQSPIEFSSDEPTIVYHENWTPRRTC